MGFSAGAELAAAAALEYDAWDANHTATPSASGASLAGVTSRPDFVGLIYPGPTPFQNKESRAITGATRLQGGGWEEGRVGGCARAGGVRAAAPQRPVQRPEACPSMSTLCHNTTRRAIHQSGSENENICE